MASIHAIRALLLVTAAMAISGCEHARLPFAATIGPNPQVPKPPDKTLIPTVHVAPAHPWKEGEGPTAAPGTRVEAFATKLKHPRWLYVLPNGDVLVAETNTPRKSDDFRGIRGAIMWIVMWRMGATVESPDRITRLHMAGGKVESNVYLKDLRSPFGMALVDNDLYVANSDAVLRFPYREGDASIDLAKGTKIVDLPGLPYNHHWTKNLLASLDRKKLYVSVGSNSNAGDHGPEAEKGRAAIWEIDLTGTKLPLEMRPFATGLRNPNGMGWEPKTGVLWTVVNERDELGSDLVPDYLTSVKEGAFYGWPYYYWGKNVDERVAQWPAPPWPAPPPPDSSTKPDYALGNHVAPLGLAFYDRNELPQPFRNGAFVGQHGSWNRRPFSGYNVVFIPFDAGKPSGPPVEILGGFVDGDDRARGRPVGVAIDKTGALLVADDVGNTIWRVSAAR
jgi:glucose/arabinose dehydrogenase